MSNDNTLTLVAAAAAGAFLYHLYAKVSMIEQAMTEGETPTISLHSLLDMAKGTEDTEDTEAHHGFGFNPRSRNIRRKSVRFR